MAVTINASTTTGLVQSADTSGIIELQNNGTTKLTVNSSGATIPTATVTTLNTPTGVLATQNGMTGIAKAWVQYAGATGTIAGSFNVSSVTRTSTGYYTINFTTSMANANYSAIGNVSTTSGTGYAFPFIYTNNSFVATAPTTSSFIITSANTASVFVDPVYVNIAVFGS